ncbi:MAG: UDP-N-acetylmuramoyl-tripeptide--D-alanyl-D-alanine ligase [Oscillospiraceae bacterium]|nr:UDP-N-acetylmuramoyl-tripeptide--D-alanyl-D-alanine ligase [Oscillospiraceae bacterium]
MITLKQAAQWCGGSVLPEYESVCFFGAENDSRAIRPGQLFVALRAARDGHDFIPNAMQAGASAALGERQLPGVPMIVVPDSLKGLQAIARGWRQSLRNTKIIGLTGSVGKTTTKEMCAAACSAVYRTAWTQKNYNNEIGVPKTILSLSADTQVAVVEMGMNHFGEISLLTSIAQPDIAVITNIGSMHLENLGSREGICRAKLEILEGLADNGTAILNYDEPLLRNAAPACRTQWFGYGEGSALRAEEVAQSPDSVSFTAVGFGQRVRVELPTPGIHNVMNALAALLASHCVGVSLDRAAAALKDFRNTGDRLRILREKGYTVIADCYNAGPESMGSSFGVFRLQPTEGRRIAVLGDMLELGSFAADAHRTVGEQAGEAADLVLALGQLSVDIARGAGTKGRHFESREALLEALRAEARPGDVLLFKGSHGMHMETILEAFLNCQ